MDSFYNSFSNFVSNENKNEEVNWGLFNFNNGLESQTRFLDSPSFPFNYNVSFLFPKKVLVLLD